MFFRTAGRATACEGSSSIALVRQNNSVTHHKGGGKKEQKEKGTGTQLQQTRTHTRKQEEDACLPAPAVLSLIPIRV